MCREYIAKKKKEKIQLSVGDIVSPQEEVEVCFKWVYFFNKYFVLKEWCFTCKTRVHFISTHSSLINLKEHFYNKEIQY